MKINALCGIILLPLYAFGLPETPSSIHLTAQHSNSELHSRACATSKDNWGNCVEADRIPTTIQASTSDTDDVSTAFLEGLKKANDGGLLHLEKGKKYIIAKKLDLSFLNNVYVKLDGEIKFTNDIKYWQANNFYHPFQKSISFWVWGGKDIKIYGSGTMNGNGQAWYDGFAGKEILVCFHLFCVLIVLMSSNLG
jgi:galacturan 1,4-alpha-galacturonidase